ncbi:MAG: HDOD domain-containing protein [Nitrospirota bacterium]
MTAKPADLVKGDVQVSSLPMVALRLNEVVNNPYSSVMDIGKIIGEDQGLTARLLRLANSPFYAFPSKIETITKAVTVIGTQQILDLVLATSVMNMFKGIPKDLITMEAFWYHSIASGVIARILAIYRREANVERFFVAGILHDVGRLVIYTKLPDAAREALVRCKERKEILYKAEREVIGFDHADVGEHLLKEWKLPLSLIEMVATHHAPSRAKHFPAEAAAVHVADIIAHALQLGSSGEASMPPLDAKAWEKLALSPSQLAPTIDQAERQFVAAIQLIHTEPQQ